MEDKDFSSSYTPFLVQKPTWNGPGRERYQEETAKVLQDLSQAYTGAEFIPVLCEMFSRALVICAEKSFESRQQTKKKTKKKEYPYFSKEYREAHAEHKKSFSEWRKAGRPSDKSHPAKAQVLHSRRHLQKTAREENNNKSIEFANDLIDTFKNDINNVCSKLKKYRGQENRSLEIPSIQTLAGK